MPEDDDDLKPPSWAMDDALARRRLAVTMRVLAPELKCAEALRMRSRGMTFRAIGQALGDSPGYVRAMTDEGSFSAVATSPKRSTRRRTLLNHLRSPEFSR